MNITSIETLEPIFFSYILENPRYFERVDPISFKNSQIRFIYQRIRDYYILSKLKNIPTKLKIRELVRLDDPTGKINDDYIKLILSTDINQYVQGKEDDWLSKKIKSWVVYNNLWSRHTELAEKLRTMNPIDYENTELVAQTVKEMINNATLMNFDDDADMGLDFDDPNSHIQDAAAQKITTGYKSLDELFYGGFSYKTLIIFMASSGAGKSMSLANFSVNAANAGKNVVYVTLEMPDKQVMKRIGSMRLKIDISEYEHRSKDIKFMQQKIKELKNKTSSFTTSLDTFDKPNGKIFVKEYPVGSAGPTDIESYIKKLQEKKGIKIDMLVVDYLTIMKPEGKNLDMFTSGKLSAEGLRAIGQRNNIVVITGCQIGKDAWETNNITMKDISQSKGIIESADIVIGGLWNSDMKKAGKYAMKILKLRDGDVKYDMINFDFNRKYLTIENDKIIVG